MMTVTTRYDLGQHVWHAKTFNARCAKPCALCDGTGRVPIAADASKEATCPDCHGRLWSTTEMEYDETRATIRPLTLGQVTVKVEATGTEVRYMAEETGVGSGTVYMEEHLYPSRAEALVACAGAAIIFDERGLEVNT